MSAIEIAILADTETTILIERGGGRETGTDIGGETEMKMTRTAAITEIEGETATKNTEDIGTTTRSRDISGAEKKTLI